MKERFQNPTTSDQIILRLLSYNSNNRADLDSVTSVDIYFLDPTEVTPENPDGRRLVESFTEISKDDIGAYSVIISLDSVKYSIGHYRDVWNCVVATESVPIENLFTTYPNLWFTTPIPIIYDFNFAFRPNRIRKGAVRYLAIEITPNVPNRDELVQYYENLAIVSPLKISMESECVACMPAEQDLRLIIDREDVIMREKCMGYYLLDTCDLDVGIYNVWFEMNLGESTYISDPQQLQIV